MKKISLFILLLVFIYPLVSIAQYSDEIRDDGGIRIPGTSGEGPLVYRLENGLTVILYSDLTMPQVTGMVVAKAGGKDDPADATGLAHYMEHMLFKGTTEMGTINWEEESEYINMIFALYDSLALADDESERMRIQRRINETSVKANEYVVPNELDRILREMGSTNINAGTGPDYTLYYNQFPSNMMERWLEVYSHRFMEPVFRSFQAELEVVYEEKNMYSDMFFMKLFEEFNKEFFKTHPYGQQPLIGTIEHLKNPSLTKMKKFYDEYYVANNMALILVGNFEVGDVQPLINDKFGRWLSGDLPHRDIWEEAPFNGREFVEKRLSPIGLGLLGFRIPGGDHPDNLALEVMQGILSNSNSTGLLDQLSINNELLQATIQNVHYNDYGTGLIIFIPKIIGQSIEDAEELIIEQLIRLRSGEFSDTLLEAVKLNLYRDKLLRLESSQGIAMALLDAFSNETDYNEIWRKPHIIREITRDDVIRVANDYFGDNYLAFHSRMGFPKHPRIEKPGYEPITLKRDTTSAYYNMVSEIPATEPIYNFVDFESDIHVSPINDHSNFYYVSNDKNDIFSLTIRYGIGQGKMPILNYSAQMMNYAGTTELTVDQFKLRMAMMGVNYSISSSDSYLTISLTGLEENLEDALRLMNSLITQPVLDEERLDILASNERAMRRLERSEPDMIADALVEYVLYNDRSSYIDRLTMRQIRRLEPEELTEAFLTAQKYAPEVHYTGMFSPEWVKDIITRTIAFREDGMLESTAPYYRAPKTYDENKVFYTHKRRALQSKIFFHSEIEEFSEENLALYSAFNTYFGGSFSGIAMQEIREYRSMAYAVGATIRQPPVPGLNLIFRGYVGTQSDKTNEATDVFVDLIRNMPQKPERTEMIIRYLSAAATTQRPSNRSLSRQYVSWQYKGFEQDPAKTLMEDIGSLTFEDILSFQTNNLSEAPIVIIMAGNRRNFDQRDLRKHGDVQRIRERRLFSR